MEAGVPIVVPIGGHGIFLDAKAFLPHMPQSSIPRKPWPPPSTWIPESVPWSAASSPPEEISETGKDNMPRLELVRLTIPRRVYTQAHMDVVAESVIRPSMRDRDEHRGLKMIYEPEVPALLPGPLRARWRLGRADSEPNKSARIASGDAGSSVSDSSP